MVFLDASRVSILKKALIPVIEESPDDSRGVAQPGSGYKGERDFPLCLGKAETFTPNLAWGAPKRSDLGSDEIWFSRGVAQPGSALPWGGSGRWFKSSRPD